MASRQSSLGKVKTAPSLFTNDTSSFNNSTYHAYAYNTRMAIMVVHEVQMYYVVSGIL